MSPRILVAGAPRSGTTWLAELLGAGGPAYAVHEPDNHRLWPAAVVAKAGRGRQPAIAERDGALEYRALWVAAAAGADNRSRPGYLARKAALKAVGTRTVDRLVTGTGDLRHEAALRVLAAAPPARPRGNDRPVVVKTVHANFSLELVASHFDHVVVVRRDPRNAVASWLDLGWEVARYEDDPGVTDRVITPAGLTPPPTGDRATDMAWAYVLLDHHAAAAAATHPEWTTVGHEALCVEPIEVLRGVYDRVGLTWTSAVEAAVADADRAGDGYDTRRHRAEQPDRWKERLTESQLSSIESVLGTTGVR